MIELNSPNFVTYFGIALCLSQSAMFSGLNLALFGISRLKLEVEVASGNPRAIKLLGMRKDSNFLLATILWGNVAANCLLTVLSDSLLTGMGAFFFSTILITCMGEIVPQAYFSRNALRVASLLAPVMRTYQVLLSPVAWPTGYLLDLWLGKEGVEFYREKQLREVIRKHAEAAETDVEMIEGRGALNFLHLDDIMVSEEGVPIDPKSIVSLDAKGESPVLPDFEPSPDDPFVKRLLGSGMKWVILTDSRNQPHLALDADGFARDLLLRQNPRPIRSYCHRPNVILDGETKMGEVLSRLTIQPDSVDDDVIDHDILLVWSEKEKRIITGADILGRLMRGIARRKKTRKQ